MREFSFPVRHLLGKLSLALLILSAACASAFASHNLAGDITYKYLGNNRVEITVTTYTDPSAANVDRCAIELELWNAAGTTKIATLTDIPRQNGPWNNDPLFPISCPNEQMGEYVLGTVKRNIYIVEHTFPGPGWYLVRYKDLARLDNITNMSNSGAQAFFIETSILISPMLGDENSPQFLNHPLDDACTGKIWTHNPGGWDPDGDSLVYKFVDCRQYDPPQVPSPITCTGFIMPDQYANNGPMTIDPTTGLITWNTPEAPGIYNIAYKIEEYRNGILIGFAFRDMAIWVYPCDNNPPVIESAQDTCIYAGDLLSFDFSIYDPDFFPPPGDSIYFYLNNNGQNNNGPFSVPTSPATLTISEPPSGPPPYDFPIEHNDTIKGNFTWQTNCDHIRPGFYQVDFYAHDNFSYYGSHMLSAHKIVKIWVVPEPVTGLTAVAQNREITLNWDPHNCNTATGYEIYRRIGGGGFFQDTVCCDTDPLDQGYELIGTTTGHMSTTFVDDNNGQEFTYGQDICYLVRATFDGGVRSCASNEVCIKIEKNFPVLLKDSIWVTDANGSIAVEWSQPIVDTIFPGPYTYTLLRAPDISGPLVWTTVQSGIPFNDTTFVDTGMNTVDMGYRYRADVYDATDQLIGEGNTGSSIYLTISPGDKQLLLSWSEFVPWTNRLYYVYRAPDFTSPLSLIATVNGSGGNTHSYLDTGLENFEDYCYVIVSEGEYGPPEVPDSVLNASQRECGIPRDLDPPCLTTVVFDTTKDCLNFNIAIEWTNPDSTCAGDVDFYTIYRADNRESDYVEIARVDSGVNFFALTNLNTIADCYGITATDTNGNESEMRIFCFENCPEIELSNVFTPNGDGVNDYFSPVKDRSVRISEVLIYDRWGSLIYGSTSVTDINRIWDGNTGKGDAAPEGVYYYVVRFEEDRLPDYVPKPPLTGHVTLLR